MITRIYDYITGNITYDYDKASDPPTGYTSDVDAILDSGTGICLDYAAVMASMLRSQRIPTRLEVGYAQDAYHAWISRLHRRHRLAERHHRIRRQCLDPGGSYLRCQHG